MSMQPQDTQPPPTQRPARWRLPPLLAFFLPRPHFWGLALLLDVNILVFVAMVATGLGFMEFDTSDLIAWGANYGPGLHGFGFASVLADLALRRADCEELARRAGLTWFMHVERVGVERIERVAA